MINCDNCRTLGFCGSHNVVKYLDVVYGAQSMTLMVHIYGGRRGIIEDHVLLFPKLIDIKIDECDNMGVLGFVKFTSKLFRGARTGKFGLDLNCRTWKARST